MSFEASFSDPSMSEVQHLGRVEKDRIIDYFDRIPWIELINQVEQNPNDYYYSPSLAIENTSNGHAIEVSIVTETDWYIFYIRPKRITKLFGLISKTKPDFITSFLDQDVNMVRRCLQALIDNDLHFLESTVKR